MISADKRFNGKFFVPTERAGGLAVGNTTETASYEFRLNKAHKTTTGKFGGYIGELTFKNEFRLLGATARKQEGTESMKGTPLIHPLMFVGEDGSASERFRNRAKNSAIGPGGILRPYRTTVACMANEGAKFSMVGELDGPVEPGTKRNEGCAPVRLFAANPLHPSLGLIKSRT